MRLLPLAIWLACLAGAALLAGRAAIDTDMSAFLPRDPSPAQRVLVDQLRDGVASRLVLVAIEGPDAAAADRAMAVLLRAGPDFAAVENGEDTGFAADRAFLWDHRFLLADAGDLSAAGLHAALLRDLAALGSDAGILVKQTLAGDPTGVMGHLLAGLAGKGGPVRRDGVWSSPDGARALLLARLRSSGADLDAAARGLVAIRSAFAATGSTGALLLTGPPVFAVEARARIQGDATRLSVLASLLVAAALLAAYRSPVLLALGFVPVASGALAGIAAVALAFPRVHGITLGFGATLIGEAVDYAVYLFSRTPAGGDPRATLARIWPTLRLGVLTSVVGFSAMMVSRFDGFAQLGVFTVAGLVAAVLVTRFVLPALMPRRFAGVRRAPWLDRLADRATRLQPGRPVVAGLVLLALLSLAFGPGAFWAGDLLSLSPVPPELTRLDQSLRGDMGAPDPGLLVAVRRPSAEAALRASEALAAALGPAVIAHDLTGFDAPSRILPSMATQRARQAALPADLGPALDTALESLPFQPGLFAPFLADLATARTRPPATRADLDGTALAWRVDALLLPGPDGWTATLPLRGVTRPAAVAAALASVEGAALIDLRRESDDLLGVYLREGVTLAGVGAGAIALLLLAALRSWRRLAAVAAPLAAAVAVTLAALRLGGHALSIFNLFGLLLVVAIGSNYALFLERERDEPARVLASLALANVCTVAGFGVLAWSRTPVLHDLGLPVAIGTLLSLVFATILLCHAPRRA